MLYAGVYSTSLTVIELEIIKSINLWASSWLDDWLEITKLSQKAIVSLGINKSKPIEYDLPFILYSPSSFVISFKTLISSSIFASLLV